MLRFPHEGRRVLAQPFLEFLAILEFCYLNAVDCRPLVTDLTV